jgi:ankyrin repeat protein
LIALLLPHVKVPLILAAYNGDIEIVRALLKNNVDINQKSSVLCAFAVAVINNNIPLVDLLLEYDANPHHAYLDDAETPFSLARGNENIANQKLFNNSQFAKPAIKDVQSVERLE